MIATPFLLLQQVRGVLFFDIGAAKFNDQDFTFQDDGRLVDAKGSVGWGFSFNFWGMNLSWDFAKRFNGKDIEGPMRTSFWIGNTF